ncbi:signal peptide peptidase SppA [Telluribacter sp. SYSU D00476]|uniref:signal peptide peptidase SppA n=1 Tax=Telluribacter sp. SYSU D00476 TaxID=2811430 RepID=UPI001FF501EA|nr:signal peptide peptidase SppA [Telluribacter sp. SYSU D00476]
MLQFLKYVLATVVGIFIFSLLSLFLLIGIGSLFSADEKVAINDNSILKIDLNKPVQEVGVENPFSDIGGPFFSTQDVIGLKDIRAALTYAREDDKIKGVYLKVESPTAGWATLEEIRNELLEFKKTKKFVYTYGEFYSEKGYYLASVADKIYLNPAGAMEWNGLSAEYEFYKGTFDKLDIKPVVFRVGEFKSAVEMFSRKDMSEASKRQTAELLQAINGHFINNIATARKLSATRLLNLADSLSIRNPTSALEHKLVTHLGYQDEFENVFRKELKLDAKKDISYVSVDKYLKAEHKAQTGDFNNRIAVLVAEGEIVSGEGSEGVISSEKLVKELKKVRDNDKVKAVVLRINSPGGSSLASDVIWREVQLTAKKKPVIASMSDMAASGGYYIAMACDTIVAQPNTITGSIGIFALLFNVENFMNNKLGITFDRVKTNQHADWPTVTREMTEFEKDMFQRSVNEGYNTFTRKAAAGRNMPVEKLRELAQGRVWSGVEAKSNGLVDVLGGLDEAILLAAKAAKLKEGDYRVRFYPEKINPFENILGKLTGNSEEKALAKHLGELAPYVKMYQQVMRMEGMQARLPYELKIQ